MSEIIRSPEEKRYPVTRIGSSMDAKLLPALPSAPTLAPATPWERVLESYVRSLDSDATRRSYKRQVEVALGALRVATLAELTGEMLLDWRAHVTASALAPATQSQALAAFDRLESPLPQGRRHDRRRPPAQERRSGPHPEPR